MYSRIEIDVDHDNQPVIKIKYKDSSDLRDKFVKKFTERFNNDSYLCVSKHDDSQQSDYAGITITPLTPEQAFNTCIQQLAWLTGLKNEIVDLNELVKQARKVYEPAQGTALTSA